MPNITIAPARIAELLSSIRESSIIVVGDTMIDEYFWGDVHRISPEAPVPVVMVESVSRRLGGAANVIQNLSRIGAKTHLISICGQDENGSTLQTMLTDIGCATEGLFKSNSRPTTIKTRIIARHQQIVRADREVVRDLDTTESASLVTLFDKLITGSGGVIVSDYGKGVVSPALLSHIVEMCITNGKYIAIDPKDRHIHLYKGVSIITPNLKEAHILAKTAYRHCSDEDVQQLGWKILDEYNLSHLLITLSERGMALFSREGKSYTHLPTVAQKVFDVTGAGDTVISIFSAAMVSGATPVEAAFLANHAAGLTVAELGTASVTPNELLAACTQSG